MLLRARAHGACARVRIRARACSRMRANPRAFRHGC
jgi:hypothetical protein